MDSVYQILAHPARRDLLALLRQREMSAGELAQALDIPKPTLSGHLTTLKAANLVYGEKHGTSITYFLNLSVLEESVTRLMDLFLIGRSENSQWPGDESEACP